MRIAVTGATGFLGGHLTRRLVDDGHVVAILARSEMSALPLRDRVARVVIGDIADPAPLDQLVRDAEIAFHLVSNFRALSDPPALYTRTTVEGTRQALAAARRAGVRRFVHCSTIGVHGHVRISPADEESPYNPGDLYQSTKVEAEQACRAEMAAGGMEIVIVRPCSMYGPGDTRMLKMFRMLAKRRFVLLGSCRQNFHAVYIDDVVDGFRLVMDHPGAAGEAFIVGGPGYVSLREYIAKAAQAVGVPAPWLQLPYRPIYWASALCEVLFPPLGKEPPLNRRRVRFFANNRAFSIAKARRVLGYAPRIDLPEGMARTVAWYRGQGLL